MRVMRIVHAADLHIDSPMRGLARDVSTAQDAQTALRCATRRAFANLVDKCIEIRADVLVIAGDLFDGNWNDNGTGSFFVTEVARLAESGTRVIFARGNHDATSEITRQMRMPPRVHELSTAAVSSIRFDDLGLRVVGRGFPERAVRDDYVRQFPKRDGGDFHLGVLHTNVGDAPGHGNYAPSDLSSLCALEYDYMALGHVHAHAILSDAPWVAYSGNLQGRHIKETGSKGALRFDVEHGRVSHVERLIVDVLRWANLEVSVDDASTVDDVHELIEQALKRACIAAEGRPVACRVHVVGATELHDKLVAKSGALNEDARSSALRIGATGTWVQSVQIATTRPLSLSATTALESELVNVLQSPSFAQDLETSFASLRRALPNEQLRECLDNLTKSAPDEAAQLLRALLAGEALS